MAAEDFDVPIVHTPTSIGRVVWKVDDPDGTNQNRIVQGSAEVLDQNGDVMDHISAKDLRNRLTAQQLQQLVAIANDLRDLAESKLP